MSFEKSENLPRYFKSINKSQPLNQAEEHELSARIKAGDLAAVHKLVKHNLKIVVTIANRHIGQGVPIDDLIQEGNIGLYEAASRFDATAGAKFVTYAQLWIRKRINEAVVAHGRIVRLPHNQEYDIYKAKVAGEETPNLSTVAIDAKLSDDTDTTVGDMLLNAAPEVDFEIELDDVKYRVRRALAHVNGRDRDIVAAYFGIDQEYAVPTEVLAERFEMTNVRVSQIVRGAINKMKQHV